MGADGHVKIFKLQPLNDKYPDSYKLFLHFIRDSVTYTSNILDTEVLTVYHGDNLYHTSMFEVLTSGIRELNPLIFESYVDSYQADEIKNLRFSSVLLYIEMANFLQNTKYDDIEVWT